MVESSESEGLTAMSPKGEARTGPSSESKKPKRKNLTTGERLRIINDFKHGIPDKYYSVNPNPRRPGEFIVRKRKTPIEYDIERPALAGQSGARSTACDMSPKGESRTGLSSESELLNDSPPSKTPSQLLTESKPALNPLAGTEFFSMQSSLNANLQRELDALHEKFNKLDAKFRKERAARKAKNQEPNQAVRRRKPAPKPQPESRALSPESEYEYEYEYVDAPPAQESIGSESEQTAPVVHSIGYSPFGLARRPNIDIRDF